MPPLADAVRFVDREAGDVKPRGQLQKSRRQQPLRSDEYKMMAAGGDLALDFDESPPGPCRYAGRRLDNRTRAGASTWSFISAISGETTTSVRPATAGGTW